MASTRKRSSARGCNGVCAEVAAPSVCGGTCDATGRAARGAVSALAVAGWVLAIATASTVALRPTEPAPPPTMWERETGARGGHSGGSGGKIISSPNSASVRMHVQNFGERVHTGHLHPQKSTPLATGSPVLTFWRWHWLHLYLRPRRVPSIAARSERESLLQALILGSGSPSRIWVSWAQRLSHLRQRKPQCVAPVPPRFAMSLPTAPQSGHVMQKRVDAFTPARGVRMVGWCNMHCGGSGNDTVLAAHAPKGGVSCAIPASPKTLASCGRKLPCASRRRAAGAVVSCMDMGAGAASAQKARGSRSTMSPSSVGGSPPHPRLTLK